MTSALVSRAPLCIALAVAPAAVAAAAQYPVRDIAPVTMLTSAPLVLVIHPALGVNSVRELVALAKTKPLINEGSEIVGSAPAAFAEFIKQDIARWTKVVKAAGIKAE